MKSAYLSKKNFEDLDLGFIFERLQLSSPYGENAKKSLKPFLRADIKMLETAYDRLAAAMDLYQRQRANFLELKSLLKEVKQLDNTFDRIAEGETLSVTELFEVKQLAMVMRKITEVLKGLHWNRTVGAYVLEPTDAIIDLLDPEHSGVGTFYIYSLYSERLTKIRNRLELLDKQAKQQLKSRIDMLIDEGYPVSASGDLRISVRDVALLSRIKSDERFTYRSDVPMYSLFSVKIDESFKTQKDQLLLEEEDEEYKVRKHLTKTLESTLALLLDNTQKIGEIDLLIAKAQFSVAFHLIRPTLTSSLDVTIIEGRHLKVAYSLERTGKTFTPISVSLKKAVTLITGANMGGKTVSLKMIGQVVAMAQYGFFVPCVHAEIPIFDYLFISVGDFQSIDMGLSTFGGEIVEIEQAIKRENELGLILIDELARGTNPLEGYAISRALIEHLSGFQSRSVITTHFDGLTSVPETTHYQVNGLSGIDLNEIRDKIEAEGVALLHEYMDYRLSEVSSLQEIPKEALRISELMGLDRRIILRAKAILGDK